MENLESLEELGELNTAPVVENACDVMTDTCVLVTDARSTSN